MDYGHTDAKNEQQFFTDGVGTNNVDKNDINSNDNLDLNSSGAAKWGNSPVRDSRSIGAMGLLSETSGSPNQNTPSTEPSQVVDLKMPPELEHNLNGPVNINEQPASPNSTREDTADLIDFNLIRAEKGSISPQTLGVMKKTVDKFENGAISPAELESRKNEAMRAYLKNSFGRELAA